jgi:hypothetical protein
VNGSGSKANGTSFKSLAFLQEMSSDTESRYTTLSKGEKLANPSLIHRKNEVTFLVSLENWITRGAIQNAGQKQFQLTYALRLTN